MATNYKMAYESCAYEAKEHARAAITKITFGVERFEEKNTLRKILARKMLEMAVKQLAIDLEKNISLQENIEKD